MINRISVYTTCFSRIADSIKDKTFSFPGSIELYLDVEIARQMAHPGDDCLLVFTLPISSEELAKCQLTRIISVRCDENFPNNYLCEVIKLNNSKDCIQAKSKCITCVNPDKQCEKCRDNPRFSDYPHYSYYMEYVPVCPKGYKDCVCDPAYIKYYHSKWYTEMYGDKPPEDVAKESCDLNDEYCYDDEDK